MNLYLVQLRDAIFAKGDWNLYFDKNIDQTYL